MQIEADAYLPVDDELIPTGEVIPVAGTAFDFRSPRAIGGGSGDDRRYDHNFCLSAARGALRRAATARGAQSSVELEVWTTESGLQFYDGEHAARSIPGLGGVVYRAHAGFCLEAQTWPDSPNRPYFPQAILRPGEPYRQTTEYRFGRAA